MSTVLGFLFIAVSFVCSVVILIAAFKDEIWKGIVGLLCGLYLLYYSLFEFDAPNKWWIVAGAFLGGSIGGALIRSAVPAARPY